MSDLRRIRKTLGLSQQRFAAAIGIGASTLSAHERGALPVPRRTMLAAVAVALIEVEKARVEAARARLRRPFG